MRSGRCRLLIDGIRPAIAASVVWAAVSHGAFAVGNEPVAAPAIDPAPCFAAAAAGNDSDAIVLACSPVVDAENTIKADRIKALIARAGAYDRTDQIDRAIGDYSTVLALDGTLSDIFNTRGELWHKKGDRPRALQDFAAAIKLNGANLAAKANYKSLAYELERLGALIAVNNKPSFNCATVRRAVEKAICADPDLANLDRQINAVNTKVVREAANGNPGAGRAMQHEQDDFIARRNDGFGRPDYDLQRALRERLEHLLAVERH